MSQSYTEFERKKCSNGKFVEIVAHGSVCKDSFDCSSISDEHVR